MLFAYSFSNFAWKVRKLNKLQKITCSLFLHALIRQDRLS